jgi:hypothetical protein
LNPNLAAFYQAFENPSVVLMHNFEPLSFQCPLIGV